MYVHLIWFSLCLLQLCLHLIVVVHVVLSSCALCSSCSVFIVLCVHRARVHECSCPPSVTLCALLRSALSPPFVRALHVCVLLPLLRLSRPLVLLTLIYSLYIVVYSLCLLVAFVVLTRHRLVVMSGGRRFQVSLHSFTSRYMAYE